MKQEEEDLLQDMLESIHLIEEYSKTLTRAKLLRDQEKQDSIARRLAIIGEIAARLPKSAVNEMSEISWKDIVGMRNKIIHDYGDIDVGVLWKTIKTDLKPLKKVLVARIKEIQ
jgi:uncharacterized protein with HEPN domain